MRQGSNDKEQIFHFPKIPNRKLIIKCSLLNHNLHEQGVAQGQVLSRGLSFKISLFKIDCYITVKKLSLPCYLIKAGRRIATYLSQGYKRYLKGKPLPPGFELFTISIFYNNNIQTDIFDPEMKFIRKIHKMQIYTQ